MAEFQSVFEKFEFHKKEQHRDLNERKPLDF